MTVIAYIWVIFMWKGKSQSAFAVLKDEKIFELLYTQGLCNFSIPKVQNLSVFQACIFYLGNSISEKHQF